jgi:hypothetical protein
VLANPGTIISFRVRADDASHLEKEFNDSVDRIDIAPPSNVFSTTTLKPWETRSTD